MCGIVGFCGRKKALPFLLDGLERLEYRGYDSAGVALACCGLTAIKAQGRLDNLRRAISLAAADCTTGCATDCLDDFQSTGAESLRRIASPDRQQTTIHKDESSRLQNAAISLAAKTATVGIGHTRWATHGAPNDKNAHPHLSRSGNFAVVHNGIIENHAELKAFLTERSFYFASQTDTEVISHLIEYYYRGDPIDALIRAAQRLHGSYALAVLCADSPDTVYAMRKDSPLVLGLARGKTPNPTPKNTLDGAKKVENTRGFAANHSPNSADFAEHIDSEDGDNDTNQAQGSVVGAMLASDISALISYTQEFLLPESGEIAILTADQIKIINFNREPVQKKPFRVDWQADAAQKNGFEHFMLKEIYEQPRAVHDTITQLENQMPKITCLEDPQRLSVIACGSAYHAGVAAKYFVEKLCRIPVDCEMASEFRYKNPITPAGTVAVAISQSGETADTIAALTEAKKSAKTLSVVNVLGSSVTRLSDEVVYTLAGPEIAVPTTKGYLSQVAALYKIGLYLCRRRVLSGKDDGLGLLKNAPDKSAGAPDKANASGDQTQNTPESCGYFRSYFYADSAAQYSQNADNTKAQTEPNHTYFRPYSYADSSAQDTQNTDLDAQTPNQSPSCQNAESQSPAKEYSAKQKLEFLDELESQLAALPMDIKSLLEQKEFFQQLSVRFSSATSAFFIGRGVDYAIAMEGALKLKEISYIHAQSYPAGELKHGTISLIEDGSLVVAVSTDPALAEKTINNIHELKSRGAVVFAITCFDKVAAEADYSWMVKSGLCAPILSAVSLQLFSYYMALTRGCDIDKPRNLAKSVTVE